MPTGPIHEHQDVLLGMPPGDLRQVKRGGFCVGMGQNQADQFAVLRTDTAEDMRVFPHSMRWHFGSTPSWSPAPDRIAHSAKPGFILKHQP
jgi:hypothetical protein